MGQSWYDEARDDVSLDGLRDVYMRPLGLASWLLLSWSHDGPPDAIDEAQAWPQPAEVSEVAV